MIYSIDEISEKKSKVTLSCKANISADCFYDDYSNAAWDSENKEYCFVDTIKMREEHAANFLCRIELDLENKLYNIFPFTIVLDGDSRKKRYELENQSALDYEQEIQDLEREQLGFIPLGEYEAFLENELSNSEFSEKIIEKLSEDVELLILLNPNNPIGNVYTNQEFEMILEAAKKYEISILIDEAYMYFYDNTFIDYALNNPHILVTRTFSKLFSLGSLRLGYVVGQPQDVKMISNLCTPHNTNAFAMRFAKAILEKDGMLDMLIKNQLEGKEYIINALKKNGFVVNAKEGNFIFVKPRKVDADIIVERMKQEKKILIKSYSEIGTLGKCLRVTTGEKIYMEKFLEALLDIDK